MCIYTHLKYTAYLYIYIQYIRHSIYTVFVILKESADICKLNKLTKVKGETRHALSHPTQFVTYCKYVGYCYEKDMFFMSYFLFFADSVGVFLSSLQF